MDENLKQRIITTLEWMIKDMKWKADESKRNFEEASKGGYSSELTEAIKVLKELKDE